MILLFSFPHNFAARNAAKLAAERDQPPQHGDGHSSSGSGSSGSSSSDDGGSEDHSDGTLEFGHDNPLWRGEAEGESDGDSHAGDGDGANAAAPAFTVADIAEVVEGPFKGMQGPVLAVGSDDGEGEGEGEGAAAAAAADADAQTVTLALTVMGRDTPVTLPMAHCLKIGTQAVAEEA